MKIKFKKRRFDTKGSIWIMTVKKINYLHNERKTALHKVSVLYILWIVHYTAKNVVVRIRNKMYLMLQSEMCISTSSNNT